MQVPSIPKGFSAVTPYLIVPDSRAAIALYGKVFGAIQTSLVGDENSVVHASVMIDGAPVMMADANPEWGMQSPRDLNGSPVSLYVYSESADAIFDAAVANGFTVTMEMQDMFWGDRFGQVIDPYGHIWNIAKQIEQLSDAEVAERAAQAAEAATE